MVQNGKQQIIIKVLCIIAAFVLWLYTSNDNNISTTYRISNIPIEIINEDYLIKSGLTLLPNQSFSTSLKITGTASDVYGVKPDHFKIIADLSVYALRKGDNRIPITIVKRPGVDINIINDDNMWITAKVDNYIEKTVPVQVKTKGNVKSGFYNEKPIIKPESVLVSGAEEYVSSVTQVITEVVLNDLDKSLNLTVPLEATDKIGRDVKDVKIRPEKAEIIVTIQKVKEVGIKVKTTGELPRDLALKSINLVKSRVQIIGDSKYLDSINEIGTEAIDLSKLQDEKTSISVKLNLPNNIKLVEDNNVIEGEVILDRIIQKTFTINVKPVKLREGLSAKLEGTSTVILVSGGKDAINRLDSSKLEGYINLDTLGKGEYNLPVIIDISPIVNIVSQTPKTIKVTIEENEKEDEEVKE